MNLRCNILAVLCSVIVVSEARAASISTIGPENRFPLKGKETDWIDGDYVIANDEIIAVIAKPGPRRDANMTVRGVGACLIDVTRRDLQSDQLSCFYPTAGRYEFHDAALVEHGSLAEGGVYWRCRSSKSLAGPNAKATIEYQLRDGDPFITVIIRLSGVDAKTLAFDGGRRLTVQWKPARRWSPFR